jgi:3-methylcrotonyl-CoA carboxylase alpha subunit
MLQRVLIANRGEIACRIIRTCRRLGVSTVAVYSRADADAMHVREADIAIGIGESPAAESYLRIDRIIDAAREAGADAIHPGYGFLSENAAFARACDEAGIVFIGPDASVIEQMGSKRAAKTIMAGAGVPTVPGFEGSADDAELLAQAERIGFPVLIKASAGGGGKGMRVVRAAGSFAEALGSARREAQSAFGDDDIILEKYLDRPRHIEVQVAGDHDGNIVHIGERDCSLQRRHQKVIEECPAPGLTDDQRSAVLAAGAAAARAVGYRNLGTVEFLMDADGQCYFLEMNTRLQVEHPVTELATGLDLVEWQLRIAAGEPLPLPQERITVRGHAIEARIYAEDPRREFMPASGRIEALSWPQPGPLLRIDTGVEAGDTVSHFYDPMIAKLSVYGKTRDEACQRFVASLAATAALGPTTNLSFLRRLARHPAFASGRTDTTLIDRDLESLTQVSTPPEAALRLAAAATLRHWQQSNHQPGPWAARDAWRLRSTAGNLVRLMHAGEAFLVHVTGGGDVFRTRYGDGWSTVALHESANGRIAVRIDGVDRAIRLVTSDHQVFVAIDHDAWRFLVADAYPAVVAGVPEEFRPAAPMPGRIVDVAVAAGDRVIAGQTLLVMEGMKMEHALKAPGPARVEAIHVARGDFVDAEAVLLELAADEQQDNG